MIDEYDRETPKGESRWRHFRGAELRYFLLLLTLFVISMSLIAPRHVVIVQQAPDQNANSAVQ